MLARDVERDGVRFAEQLGATPFQVGLAYSFVFVLTPVQILSTALVPRYGFKAVMLGGWRTRRRTPCRCCRRASA